MIPYFLTSSDMNTSTHTVQPTYTLPASIFQNASVTKLPFPQQLLQATPAIRSIPEVHWDHLPWDEEFHIEHHRENLRKVDDLLAQLARIAYGH